jgi:hypothetical protein
MFYTAQGEIVDTVKLDRITFVDTRKSIIRNHNEAVIDRAKVLIDLTVKKFQHIVAMRGMIMNETSSLDMQMLDIIKLALESQHINFDELAHKIYDQLNRNYNDKNSFVNKCREKNNFIRLTSDNAVFSADYKIKTLGQILYSLDIEDYSEDYKNDINAMRNKFAHATLQKDKISGREYFKHGDTGVTFDEDLCRKIRMDMIKYKQKFNETLEKMKSNPQE